MLVLMQNENCRAVLTERGPYFASLQRQFVILNATLSMYVGTDVAPHQEPDESSVHHVNAAVRVCLQQLASAGTYPNIRFLIFKPHELLADELDSARLEAREILKWPSTYEHAVVRGDVYRLLLAIREEATYLDADVILLGPSRSPFQRAFVALTLFADQRQNADEKSESSSLVSDLERAMTGDLLSFENRERLFSVAGRLNLDFTNAAFCLPRATLRSLLEMQFDRIREARDHEKEQEWGHFGSSVFRAHFLNTTSGNSVVALYATNPPKTFEPAELSALVKRYGMRLLHLSGFSYRQMTERNRQYLSSFDALAHVLLDDYATYSTTASLAIAPPFPTPIAPPGPAFFRCKSFFTTIDGMLAGTTYKKRGDCCLEMKGLYFRSLLVEATRQAANASSSLTVYVNAEPQYSRCGGCFSDLFRTLQTNPAATVFATVNNLDAEEARTNAEAHALLRSAFKKGTLLLQAYSPPTLLKDAGLAAGDTAEVLLTVADLIRSYSALQFTRSATYSINETFVSNVQALEVLEALTVLCLAANHAQTFVGLNVLLLDTSPSMYMEPFIALATRPSAKFEATAFVTSHAFCAPPEVLRAAAQSVISTHVQRSQVRDRAIIDLQALQARRRAERQAALDAKMRKAAKGRPRARAIVPPVNETTLPRHWQEETDVEDHEHIAAQALQTAWFRALHADAPEISVRLLTLCSPHHTAVAPLMADARALRAKFAVVSSALVEKAVRQRVHQQVLAQRGVKIVQGKVVRVEPYTLPQNGEEVVGELIRLIRAAADR